MGDKRGTRAGWRAVTLAVGAALIATGLVVPQPALAAQAAPATVQASEQELATALKTYLAAKNGSYSVTVRELDGDQRSVSLNGTRRVEPASTIKLFYAWAVLRAVDNGTLALDARMKSGATIGGCLRVMIEVSDNYCAIDFRLLLGMRNLNRLFASEGYTDTYIVLDSQGRYVTKRTSTDDLALLLSRLEEGVLLSDAQTMEFKKRLLAQIWRHRFSSGIPTGTVVGSKSGQLWVSSGMVEADTGIFYGPNSTYVITAIGTNGAPASAIRGIATIVYRHLQGPVDVKAVYPAQQFVTKIDQYIRKTAAGTRIRLLKAGTAVQVLSSIRGWMRVKAGSTVGWVAFSRLSLRDAYRWPEPERMSGSREGARPGEPTPSPEPPGPVPTSPPGPEPTTSPEPSATPAPGSTSPPGPEPTSPPSPDPTPQPTP